MENGNREELSVVGGRRGRPFFLFRLKANVFKAFTSRDAGNPEGVASPSPGLARGTRAYPGNTPPAIANTERVPSFFPRKLDIPC